VAESRVLLKASNGLELARLVFTYRGSPDAGELRVLGHEAEMVTAELNEPLTYYDPRSGTESGVFPQRWPWVLRFARDMTLRADLPFSRYVVEDAPELEAPPAGGPRGVVF
jgi:hypothetical protein